MSEEKNEELKRQTLNAGDAEMDRGHKKKLGSKLVLGRDNPGYNPFQETQNSRNNWIVSKGDSNGTTQRPYKPQVYRQNPKNKFHSKFGRNGTNGGGRHFNGGGFKQSYNRQPNK